MTEEKSQQEEVTHADVLAPKKEKKNGKGKKDVRAAAAADENSSAGGIDDNGAPGDPPAGDSAPDSAAGSENVPAAGSPGGEAVDVPAHEAAAKDEVRECRILEEDVLAVVTFELTEQEFSARGKEAAALQSEVNMLNVKFSGVKEQHKAEVSIREGKISEILSTIRRGKEDREVPCKQVYDYEHGMVRVFHLGKVVEQREMRPAEKQTRMKV